MKVNINKLWYFTLSIAGFYLIIGIVSYEKILQALKYSAGIFINIIPVFIFVIFLMTLTNYFIEPKKLTTWLNKKQGWLIAIIAGIISSGPIYMWYPLLNDLQKKGIKNRLIATFLYNRAVKIALLPLIIFYFGITYTIILTTTMIFLSILNGWIVEKIVN